MSMHAAQVACRVDRLHPLLSKSKGLGGWGTLYLLQRLGEDGQPEQHFKVGRRRRHRAALSAARRRPARRAMMPCRRPHPSAASLPAGGHDAPTDRGAAARDRHKHAARLGGARRVALAVCAQGGADGARAPQVGVPDGARAAQAGPTGAGMYNFQACLGFQPHAGAPTKSSAARTSHPPTHPLTHSATHPLAHPPTHPQAIPGLSRWQAARVVRGHQRRRCGHRHRGHDCGGAGTLQSVGDVL